MPAMQKHDSSIKFMAAALVQQVRDYTNDPEHEHLGNCHHFLFNLPEPGCKNVDEIKYIIIGQNPGMSAFDREDLEQIPPYTCREETSDHDYREYDHEKGRRIGKRQVKSRKYYKWQKIITAYPLGYGLSISSAKWA